MQHRGDRNGEDQPGPDQVRADHHPLAIPAIDERSGERAHHRRGERHGGEDQAQRQRRGIGGPRHQEDERDLVDPIPERADDLGEPHGREGAVGGQPDVRVAQRARLRAASQADRCDRGTEIETSAGDRTTAREDEEGQAGAQQQVADGSDRLEHRDGDRDDVGERAAVGEEGGVDRAGQQRVEARMDVVGSKPAAARLGCQTGIQPPLTTMAMPLAAVPSAAAVSPGRFRLASSMAVSST